MAWGPVLSGAGDGTACQRIQKQRPNMKFGIFRRLTAGYLAVLFLLGASDVYAILKLVEFNTVILASYNEDIRLLDSGKRIADSLFSQRQYEQKFLLTRDAVLNSQFLAAQEDFERYLAELFVFSAPPERKETLEKIKVLHQRYLSLVSSEVKYLKTNRSYNKISYKAQKEKATDSILEALEKLEEYTRQGFYQKARMMNEASASARTVAVASFLLTVLLVVLLAYLITRSITNPLIKLVNKTREIQSGVFTCDLYGSAPPEIRELNEAFNRMCNRLKEVDKIKSDFFAMISHELKTPLTTISEGISLLLEGTCGSITEKQNRLLTIITAESNRLARLVNSILNLSKMEAGMMKYEFVKERIEPLIEQAVKEILPYAEAKRIHLEKRIGGDLPSCPMDAERILEALRNLIGNAVKFTPEEGRIKIAAAARPANGGLEVSVSDSGPGVPREKLLTIFEKYESTDQKKGTGLGLAIVKHIITAHGGKVWAESEPGAGTRFIFVLPS